MIDPNTHMAVANERDKLLRENDALRDENTALSKECGRWVFKNNALLAERDAYRDAATARDRNEDALRADVERLNQMLRDKGLGQGEIDAWAKAVENAARYQWLRDVALGMDQIADPDNGVQVWWGTDPARSAYGKDLDEAVDRGMKEKP